MEFVAVICLFFLAVHVAILQQEIIINIQLNV